MSVLGREFDLASYHLGSDWLCRWGAWTTSTVGIAYEDILIRELPVPLWKGFARLALGSEYKLPTTKEALIHVVEGIATKKLETQRHLMLPFDLWMIAFLSLDVKVKFVNEDKINLAKPIFANMS